MRSVLPLDEINNFKLWLHQVYIEQRNKLTKDDEDDIIDEMFELFLMCYSLGNEVTNASLSSNWKPTLDDVLETVDRKVDGKTWKERVEEYFSNNGNEEDLIRIVDTESHRIANDAALKTAIEGGATSKTWMTMLDDKVRDTHFPLEGQTIPIDADFYTWDGDKAQAPGLFEKAENNVNCRCELAFGQ